MTAIAVERLNLSLGGLPILKDISFTIEDGQVVGLLGANGSGKTTLVRALLGLLHHQDGQIRLLDQTSERFSAWDQLGYVPQRASVSLHSTTVAEVVSSGTLAKRPWGWTGPRRRARVGEALALVGLADQADELYLHLSGGQQQRVLIARGIVNRPRLIIMDEPFAGVDLDSQREIAATLASFAATILVVLHETEPLADQLDRTLVLREGRLVYDGAPITLPNPGQHPADTPLPTQLLSGMEPRWAS